MSLLLLWAGVNEPGPPAVPPSAPCLGCEELSPGACVIGRGETRILLLDHCGKRIISDITDSVSFSKYGRELDDDSELEVSLHLSGDAVGRACCEHLENTRTWRNELVVVRDGKTVWGPGPIVTIKIQREIAHLVARDITAWLDVRLVHNDYQFVEMDLAEIAEICIKDALLQGAAADLPAAVRDVCILNYAQFSLTGKTTDMEILSNQKTAGEVLRDLAGQGLDFTVINRSLIVGGNFAFGPIGPLHDEDFMVDLEVSEHGLAAATKWFVSGDTVAGNGAEGSCGGADDYYGLIERGVEGVATTVSEADLNQQACERLSTSNPPPFTINVPSEAHLSPKAPVCMEVLIPGTYVDISIREMCRMISVRQRLSAVQVINDNRGERVAVTISPLGPLELSSTTGE